MFQYIFQIFFSFFLFCTETTQAKNIISIMQMRKWNTGVIYPISPLEYKAVGSESTLEENLKRTRN